jgi:hypothetical protein
LNKQLNKLKDNKNKHEWNWENYTRYETGNKQKHGKSEK